MTIFLTRLQTDEKFPSFGWKARKVLLLISWKCKHDLFWEKHITSHWSRMQASSDGFCSRYISCANRPFACYYSQGLVSDNSALCLVSIVNHQYFDLAISFVCRWKSQKGKPLLYDWLLPVIFNTETCYNLNVAIDNHLRMTS